MIKVFKLVVIAVVALVSIFLIQKASRPKDVIDPSQPITKRADETKVVLQGGNEVVQVRFYWEIEGIKYNDALYIPKDVFEKMSQDDLDKLKKQRFDNWINSINESSKAKNQ